MLFRLTAKAKEQLSIFKLEKHISTPEKEFFFEWNIDVAFINHKKYFIITEGKTLFTVIKHAKGIKNIQEFEIFIGEIFTNLFNELVEGVNLKQLNLHNCIYASTENNNVRISQIDHLYHAKHLVEKGINTFEINRIPIASIGYQFPVDYFIKELGKILERDGFVYIEDVLRN